MPEDGLLSRYTRQLKAADVEQTTLSRGADDDARRRVSSAPSARNARPRPRRKGPGVLILRQDREDEQAFELGNDRTTIGRSHQNDIALDDSTVSRVHAIITRDPKGTYRLRDDDSANGTYVNEQRISEQVLADGDVIQVGLTVLAFRQG